MKFIQRLSFYLGGVSIGLIFLVFFLTGKRTQCTWFPESRVLADIGKKAIRLSPELRENLIQSEIDTLSIQLILKYGAIDFSKSETEATPCRFYHISGREELKNTTLWVRNCERYAMVEKIIYNDND